MSPIYKSSLLLILAVGQTSSKSGIWWPYSSRIFPNSSQEETATTTIRIVNANIPITFTMRLNQPITRPEIHFIIKGYRITKKRTNLRFPNRNSKGNSRVSTFFSRSFAVCMYLIQSSQTNTSMKTIFRFLVVFACFLPVAES